MYEYSVDNVEERKYIQVNCMRFYSFIKKNFGNAEYEKVHKRFCDHHCDVYRNDSMFVLERFFWNWEYGVESAWTGEFQEFDDDGDPIVCDGNRIMHYLKKYVESKGFVSFSTPEEYREAEVDCIFPGYAGILMDVTW